MQLKTILRQVPDPRGKQGQDYMLWSILSLIIVSLLCGRRGMKAAFLLGRSLSLTLANLDNAGESRFAGQADTTAIFLAVSAWP